MTSLCISVALAGCATAPQPAPTTPPTDPALQLQECQAQVEVLKRRLAKVADIERNSAPKDH